MPGAELDGRRVISNAVHVRKPEDEVTARDRPGLTLRIRLVSERV